MFDASGLFHFSPFTGFTQDLAESLTGLQTFSGLLAFAPQLPHSTVGLSDRQLIVWVSLAAVRAHICSLWLAGSHFMVKTSFGLELFDKAKVQLICRCIS
jgi:hypothetical protein